MVEPLSAPAFATGGVFDEPVAVVVLVNLALKSPIVSTVVIEVLGVLAETCLSLISSPSLTISADATKAPPSMPYSPRPKRLPEHRRLFR